MKDDSPAANFSPEPSQPPTVSRRHFLGALGGIVAAVTATDAAAAPAPAATDAPTTMPATPPASPYHGLDLAPARWIWFPSQRTLANSFILFRRELDLRAAPVRATGWIAADSRYRLTLNGQRVQWGPPPCDPRTLEADPVDLSGRLRAGRNVLGAEVLYYGHGEGTWPMGKPGFLFRLDLEYADGATEQVVSDASWLTVLDRAHTPGQYKRWFLRALQEEFDASLHPHGWDTPAFAPDARWLPAMLLPGRADKPAFSAGYWDYAQEAGVTDVNATQLRRRMIPMLRETPVAATGLLASGRVQWRRDPLDWFEFRTPDAFTVHREPTATPLEDGWRFSATPDAEGIFATFAFAEQMVGWPYFTIDAPEGTVIELMTQEAHDPERAPWLDTHFFQWTRFVCREGENWFETFDFESFRFLQLHIRHASRPVTVRDVGVRRRVFPWPQAAAIRCGEPALQRLFDASVNTLNNSAQETCVDGMGRERQQYSGDGSHQLHAVRYAFGEYRLPARFISTFSQGLALDGYFLDCWPAYDRLARVMERQVGASYWGPLLDHGIGFVFDAWNHYMESGDRDAVAEAYPRLLRFADYLLGLLRPDDGLLPVENIGVPAVYIDHNAFRHQREKQCALNLYTAAMLGHALAPLCRAFGNDARAAAAERDAARLLRSTVARFWDARRALFVNNLPWQAGDGESHTDDRSLATSVLFNQCPGGAIAPALAMLAETPPEMGFSYPANAVWRLWALAHGGRIDVVLKDLRERWAPMRSVLENNTLQEFWHARTDATDLWSHCALAPLDALFMDVMGLRPAAPGFRAVTLRPQTGDLEDLDVTARTPRGDVRLVAKRAGNDLALTWTLPRDIMAELLLPPGAVETSAAIKRRAAPHPMGLYRFTIAPEAGPHTVRIPRHFTGNRATDNL